MIGAISFSLTAMTDDSIPIHNGNLTHGLCFELMERTSPALARRVHGMQIKPFTSSFMVPHDVREANGRYYIKSGTRLKWRVTALADDVLDAFLSVRLGDTFKIGNLTLNVEGIAANPEEEPRTGIFDEHNIVSAALAAPEARAIRFDFLTLTSFRSNGEDFIAPTPEKIFGSLADKWTAMSMPSVINADEIRKIAASMRLTDWTGHSSTICFSKKTNVSGFTGRFIYDMTGQEPLAQKKLLMLSQYAELSGTGRLTAQGLGQTKVSCG